MSDRPRLYFDLNIIGYIRDGIFAAERLSPFDVVYSNEHLTELLRASNPDGLLEVLDKLQAQRIDIVVDEHWRLTDTVKVHPYQSVRDVFAEHKEATQHMDAAVGLFISSWLGPLAARILSNCNAPWLKCQT